MKTRNAVELVVVNVPIRNLTAYSRNARTHSKRQIRQIADSIRAFGFTNPILIDQTSTIIAGHGRVEAAKLLGMTEVPTVCLENLTQDQIRAYVIADNRLAEAARWDEQILKIELQHLVDIQCDFDITITGFEVPEIDLILQLPKECEVEDDTEGLFEKSHPVCQVEDLWELGQHRIFCGNSLQESSFSRLLGSRQANMIFTDPPYNVPIDGHATGNGTIKHREFAMASGEMTRDEFIEFLETIFQLLARHSVSGSVHFVCMDWAHAWELLSAGNRTYGSPLNLCVWAKDQGGMGSFYRSQHELVFVFRNGKGSHRNNIQLGRYGRNRTNVWRYSGSKSFSKKDDEGNLLALHPTVKPVALVADAILDCSKRGDIILDGFLGSGSTLIAAERTGRVCYGIEIDPLYVDVAIRRWQRHTGDRAIHGRTGIAFDELAGSQTSHE